MTYIKKLFKFIINYNLSLKELFLYNRKYVLLPRLMGFKQNPSILYRAILFYEYTKLRYYNPNSDTNYILDCLPRVFYKYYLSHKTHHFEYGHECVNKQLFYQILDAYNLPYPNTYFIINNNTIHNLFNKTITFEQIDKNKFYFSKMISGSGGKDALIIRGSKITIKQFNSTIFQEVCQNHDLIKKLAPTKAFNTIRVHTYFSKKQDKMIILAAHIKLAAKTSICDNIGAGGIGVEIDTESGKLAKYGFSEFIKERLERYPGSCINFEGFSIPYWNQLIKYLEKASKIFGSKLIGWDIGITNNGVVFIEGNSGSDYFIPQCFYKPFYNSLIISDQLAVSKYHSWIKKYEKKYHQHFDH